MIKVNYLSTLTPEDRAEIRFKSSESKRLAKEKRESEAHLYKTTWADSNHWQTLAVKHSIRMPNELQAPTLTWMRKYLNRLNIVHSEWTAACGLKSLQQWLDLNPKHTLYAFVGNVLEYKDAQFLIGVNGV